MIYIYIAVGNLLCEFQTVLSLALACVRCCILGIPFINIFAIVVNLYFLPKAWHHTYLVDTKGWSNHASQGIDQVSGQEQSSDYVLVHFSSRRDVQLGAEGPTCPY